jgi:hypothetical protein
MRCSRKKKKNDARRRVEITGPEDPDVHCQPLVRVGPPGTGISSYSRLVLPAHSTSVHWNCLRYRKFHNY